MNGALTASPAPLGGGVRLLRDRLCDAGEVTSRTARSPRTNPLVRREQILDAAILVFGTLGFRQGSLKDVAARVGLSVQGVLHHFPSKEILLLETLDRRNELRVDALDRVAADEGVIAMLQLVLRENLQNPGLMRLFVTLAAEATDELHPAHDYFVRRYAAFHDRLRVAYETDVALGRAQQADPDHIAAHLVAVSDGLQLQYLLNRDMDLLASFDAAVAHLKPPS